MMKAILAALGATSLVVAPVAHAASPATAPISQANQLGGEGSIAPWIIALIIVGGIILAISESDVDSPDSP